MWRRGLVAVLCVALTAGCGSGGQPQMRPAAQPSHSLQAASLPPPSQPPSPVAGTEPCGVFPANNIWRADVSGLPVHSRSNAYVASIGAGSNPHPDFGSGMWEGHPIGIPVTSVKPGQSTVSVRFEYAGESDRGPYPVPADVKVEGGSDSHIILHDAQACRVYELFAARKGSGGWRAGSGAVFDLRSNDLRRAGWTSADAAGLSIFAGLVRYQEVAAGHIDHAIRITAPRTANKYVWPARHAASSSSDPDLPPMGLRLRLKKSVDISRLPKQARIIAEAMQRYGVILADNGSPWYISGAPDNGWSNGDLRALKNLRGSDFEAVDVSGLMVSPNSGQVR